jgi:Ca-activated chloride channel family protein
MEFRFAQPQYFVWLFLLIPVAGIILWDVLQRQRLLTRFAETTMLKKLVVGGSGSSLRLIKSIFIALAIALIILSLTRPQAGLADRSEIATGVDLYVLVDVSRSMLSPSRYSPEMSPAELRETPTRLEHTKTLIATMIKRLRGDRVGLIPFSAEAFVFCPLTLDHRIALDFLNELSTILVGVQGTHLGTAIDVALESFDGIESDAERIIVLVTDGEDHSESTQASVQKAADRGVKIYTIGIGSELAAPIPMEDGRSYMRDPESDTVVLSRPDFQVLRQISQTTGGEFYHVQGSGMLEIEALSQELENLEQTVREEQVFRVTQEQFSWLLIPALILLLIEFMLPANLRQSRSWREQLGKQS